MKGSYSDDDEQESEGQGWSESYPLVVKSQGVYIFGFDVCRWLVEKFLTRLLKSLDFFKRKEDACRDDDNDDGNVGKGLVSHKFLL